MKKQAIKITTAAAIAASAFVAVAPTQSEAATSSVDKAITKATNQMAKAYDTYHKAAKNEGKLPATGTIRNQVKLANEYYAAATKEIAKNGGSKTKKAAYTKTLNEKKYFLDRAEAYLAAVNTNLNPAKNAFNEAVEGGKQKTVLAAQKAYNDAIKGFEAKVDKIYGPDARNLLKEKYAEPAQKLADSVNDEMKVYNAYKDIEQKDLIEKDLEAAYETIQSVKDQADKIAKLDTKLAENITKAVEKNNAAFEKAVKATVAIEGITDGETTEEETKTITVKATKGSEIKVTLNGKAVAANENGSYTLKLEEGSNKVAVESTVYGVKTELNKEITSNQTPKVKNVSAVNAKEVEIKFNKAIKKSTVLNGSNEVQNISFSPVGNATNPSTLTGSLSADGKTLTVSATTSFSGSYTVVATDDIKTTDEVKIEDYKKVVDLEDSVRPTVGQAVYNSNNIATFSFSEPIDVASNAALANALTLKDASGATYTPTVVLAANKKSFTLDLNAATFETGKAYTLTVTGLKDFAGNLITPNPLSVSVEKKVVDNVAPTVSSVTSNQAGYVVVKFSEKVSVNANKEVASVGGVTADLDTNASLDESGTVLTVRDSSFNGTKDIAVNTFTDVAGNAGTARTVLVNFPVDSVNPTVSSSAVKVIDNKNYLVLTFSEDVTVTNDAGNITGTYVTENGVEKNVTSIDTSVAANVSQVAGTKNQVKVLIDSQEKGKYSVSLPAGLVTDVVGNGNAIASSTYTVGANTSETTKPTIVATSVQSGDNNTITIEFSEKLATSSLNLNNFLVEGATVAEKAVFTDTDQDTIKLTLKEGAIKTSGTYNFTVQNVADIAGNVMVPVTQAEGFIDNDVPALTAATLTSNDVTGNTSAITLTFDEAILPASIAEDTAVADFDIFVDGVALGTANVTEEMGSTTNKVTLTIDRALTATEAAKTITIKPATGFDVTDLEGNNLPNFTSVTVTK
ncbi:Ig-like domain-containing protein [Peribacillus sp. NPDC097225]|uniref:Ig-like domain-containing protein n=1 Tax=Peribacillus sp. NPDC097225 TaxID=3364400 RepID=UPI00382A48A6